MVFQPSGGRVGSGVCMYRDQNQREFTATRETFAPQRRLWHFLRERKNSACKVPPSGRRLGVHVVDFLPARGRLDRRADGRSVSRKRQRARCPPNGLVLRRKYFEDAVSATRAG